MNLRNTKLTLQLLMAVAASATAAPHRRGFRALERGDEEENIPSPLHRRNSNNNNNNNNNQYASGCLYGKDLTSTKRVCNSDDGSRRMGPSSSSSSSENDDDDDDDDNELQRQLCSIPLVPYRPEIRLIAQDWTTAMFETWIIQIILSELLDVPTTIEAGSLEASQNLNFYAPVHNDRKNWLEELDNVSSTYYYTAFDNAHRLKDCTLAGHRLGGDDGEKVYEECGHFITESWGARKGKVQDYVYRGILDPPQALGAIGQEGWHIPKFTATKDPSLLSYLGLAGETNRMKLAKRFRRPTTWKYYCDNISPSGCTIPDDIAKMPPPTSNDYDRMFVDGLYTGHFRETEKNNCDMDPTNCTGHFVDYPCQWRSAAVTQAHYLNIAVDGDGYEDNNLHSYSYSQMIEIWKAANATKSDVMMYFWSPSELMGEFHGSDFEFVRVDMPTATQECLDRRSGATERCSDDPLLRIGDPRAICQEPPNSLHSLMVSTLFGSVHDPATPVEATSPAYNMLKNFRITELQLEDIFLYLQGSDGDAREAVCNWAATNVEYLSSFVPHTYPREYVEKDPATPLTMTSLIVGFVAIGSTLLATAFLSAQRNYPRFQKLPLEFLSITLGGVLLVAVAAILMGIHQSNWSCTMEVWLVNIGYTMMLVPHIVTVHAINSIGRAAVRFRRKQIVRSSLLRAFASIALLMVAFLILWTVLDPPRVQQEFHLLNDDDDDNDDDEPPGRTDDGASSLVAVSAICRSDSMAWDYVSVGWVVLLLLVTSVLAFQMNQMTLGDFDESPTLALLIYSHLFFALCRLVTYFLHGVDEYVLSRIRSLIFSADALAVLTVYFLPKFWQSARLPEVNSRRRSRLRGASMSFDSNGNLPTFEQSAMEENSILKGRIRILEEELRNLKEGSDTTKSECSDKWKSSPPDLN